MWDAFDTARKINVPARSGGNPIHACSRSSCSHSNKGEAERRFGSLPVSSQFGSNIFESNKQIFPALITGKVPAEIVDQSSLSHVSAKIIDRYFSNEIVGQGQVLIGQDRWFRPTPRLISLFSHTGTKHSKPKCNHTPPLPHPTPPEYPSPPARLYADVAHGNNDEHTMVKEMAGSGARGGASQSFPRGGGQGIVVGRRQGYNPGFQLGFTPGYDGGR